MAEPDKPETQAAPDAAPSAAPPKEKAKPLPPVTLDRFNILPGSPIPELSTPSARAYVAEDKRNSERKLFALICPPMLGARTGVMEVLKGANIRGAMSLVEWGVVTWPLVSQRTIAVIYERPSGGRLLDHLGQIGQHEMVRKIIEPLCHGLMELSSRGVSHRQIRPSNLYFMDGSTDRLVLGDCTTVPSGYDQPILFETLERGAAPPAGRGAGDVSDDMYALGVSIIFALAGGNPVPHLRTDDEILYAKMIDGSYSTLVAQEPIPANMVECLRGLLSDDEHERWSLEQLDLWINGRRLTPIQKKSAPKAKRYIDYAGREHFNTRTLSLAVSRMPSQVDRLVKDNLLETWLKRDLENSDLSAAASNAIHMAQNQSGDKDLIAARISIVLDPSLPVRYKDCWFMPDGFGTTLAHSILQKGNANTPVEVISRGLPRAWFDAQDTYNPVYVALEKNFDQLMDFVQERKIGYGIERCLYETNPTLPCQSPLIVDEYVTTIKDLMPALERVSAKVDKKLKPIDRHIVAFIAARLNQNIDPHLKAVGDERIEIATLGMLSLLALVQWRTKSGAMMGFTSWVGAHMGPAIKAYHSKSIREELEKEVPKLIRKGNLADLFNLLDNAEQRAQDQMDFKEACEEFENAENEIKDIEGGSNVLAKNSSRLGQQAAAMTSIVIALLIMTVSFVGKLWQNMNKKIVKKPIKRVPKKSGGGLMLLGMLALFAALILMLVSMASLVLVVFGMLPTFVAALVDRSAQRFAFISVLAMNLAGVFPYLLDLWMGANNMSVAIDSLTDVFSLFTMYGSAALGWVLFIVTPPVVTTGMTFIAQRRVAILRASQKKLLAEWGNSVAQLDDEPNSDNETDKEPGAPGAPNAPKT